MSFYPSDPDAPSVLYARDLLSFRSCVSCSSSAPACPTCDTGYTCTMTSQSCTSCATTQCVKSPTSGEDSGSNGNSGGGTNTGAIAGGVVGGVAFVAIATFLVWWFFIRKKRQEQQQAASASASASEGEKASTVNSGQQSRKSTHSIASTVLTRASNVIQIAYIPGVTNRSPPETPGHLVPPVPPLPGAHPDQHFFMPGDLRDSTWSDASNDRGSVAPSLRSSVATTIYRNNAIVSPMPAQQVMRTKAAMVNINGAENAPAVPAITQAQLNKAGVTTANSNSSIVARTVTAKPVMVRGPSKKKNTANATASPAVQTIQEQPETTSAVVSRSGSQKQETDPSASGFDATSSDEEDAAPKAEPAQASQTATAKDEAQSRPATVIEDSPAVDQSPFQDQPTPETKRASSLLETPEGTRSNRSSRHLPPRVESPFSDANEVK
ncbi:hypothetical protein BO70DRAFT_369482 [Aspergillus heteromorphus CBS 117.55]|uniref:Membrane anchor Opy2 N-terminal domain-containing protein n=1 Tax=Aspergillus heteromorphus CBS 117.55 TaxID=1448321 RepID=A0A317WQB1_9EURO|nr:uncharacterized protein BO70DRAFT_369482 [Aspergillus heteromorphus CBS 117.55]PWY87472.1 hypothetical protein BO70DRAFT_369482 [Aspergillus heteromorphus CBS 117.55]